MESMADKFSKTITSKLKIIQKEKKSGGALI